MRNSVSLSVKFLSLQKVERVLYNFQYLRKGFLDFPGGPVEVQLEDSVLPIQGPCVQSQVLVRELRSRHAMWYGQKKRKEKRFLKVGKKYWEFPGDPVVRTPITAEGLGSFPGQETKILQAVYHGQKKKRGKNAF